MNIKNKTSKVKMYNKLSRLPLGSVTAEGWLRDQLIRSKNGMGGHLDELEPKMIANTFINYSCFEHPNKTFAAGWSSEISGTYWTGLVELAFTLNDEDLKKKAEKWVNGVIKHQEADGYLGGYPADTNRNADYNAWGANWCYRAMLSYYDATGREDVLNAVYKGLLWFCDNWKDNKTEYVGSTLIESMICVYALTGDKKLVEFCEDWLNWLEDNSKWKNKVSQFLTEEIIYNSMHTVAWGEDVKHPAIVYCATGDERLKNASVRFLDKGLEKILQPTGGPCSNAEFLSPVSSVSETEYCNFSTFNHTYSWMTMVTGSVKYGDLLEKCAFNGSQGARKKDERAIAYMSSPNQHKATKNSSTYGANISDEVYAPNYHVACCPAQSVRTMPEFLRSMCFTDNSDDVYFLCYGPAFVKYNGLSLKIDTQYPFRDKINIDVMENTGKRIYLRIPGWCSNPTIKQNGKSISIKKQESGFYLIDTDIISGDKLEIIFPMTVKAERIDDSDMSSKFPIMYSRGPLVYSLPLPEKWTPYPGEPRTPLPEDWSWFEIEADLENVERFREPWAMVADEDLDINSVKVKENEGGYVWENPQVELYVPMKLSPYIYRQAMQKNVEFYGQTADTEGEAVPTRLVPYGCTNLRITYFLRAKKN